MEGRTTGGARVERNRARRAKEKDGAATTTSPTIAGWEGDTTDKATVATNAGTAVTFQNGQGDGDMNGWVPEAAICIKRNIMQ